MKHLSEYIFENNIINDEINKIYEYLSNSNFKISFKKLTPDKAIACYNEFKNSNKDLIKIFGKDLYKGNVYCIKIWNGGKIEFDESPRYNQAEICFHGNNTNARYYILCERFKKCTLVYCEHRDYGLKTIYGEPYMFNI